MMISPVIAIMLLIAWLAGVGLLGLHNFRRIRASKALGFFDNGLGTRISRTETPFSFKAAMGLYWFGVAGAAVMFVGGLVLAFVVVIGR